VAMLAVMVGASPQVPGGPQLRIRNRGGLRGRRVLVGQRLVTTTTTTPAPKTHEELIAEELQRREEELLRREEEQKRRDEELERRKQHDILVAEELKKHEALIAEELERREQQKLLVAAELERRKEHEMLLAEELERRKEHEVLLAEELESRKEHEVLLAEELERRKEHEIVLTEELEKQNEHKKMLAEEIEMRELQAKLTNKELGDVKSENVVVAETPEAVHHNENTFDDLASTQHKQTAANPEVPVTTEQTKASEPVPKRRRRPVPGRGGHIPSADSVDAPRAEENLPPRRPSVKRRRPVLPRSRGGGHGPRASEAVRRKRNQGSSPLDHAEAFSGLPGDSVAQKEAIEQQQRKLEIQHETTGVEQHEKDAAHHDLINQQREEHISKLEEERLMMEQKRLEQERLRIQRGQKGVSSTHYDHTYGNYNVSSASRMHSSILAAFISALIPVLVLV